MGRIVVAANIFEPGERTVHQHSGPFIDWLLAHYPDGFATPHLASLNLRRLAVEDYDTELGDGDTLALVILPAVPAAAFAAIGITGFWSYVASAAVGLALSIGINYAINALFGPKASTPQAPRSLASTPAAGSVYSLSIPTNLARLGQPIPVCYGRNLVVPDIASEPYSYYAYNEQYVCQILSLGQGEFDVEQIKFAQSNVDEMQSGVVDYWVYPSSLHQETFGVIQAATGVLENVYTSPEVSDQELFGALGGVFTTFADMWTGCFTDCDDGDVLRSIFWLGTPAGEYAEALRDGRPVYMEVPSGANEGIWDVGFIVNSDNPGDRAAEWMYQRGYVNGSYDTEAADCAYTPTTGWATSKALITLTYTPPCSTEDGGAVGPFVASPACMLTEHLQYDINFPAGCYKINSETGALEPFTVGVTFTAEAVDNDGVALGVTYTQTWSETMATNTPQRRTIDHIVPKGRYRVTAQRTTPKSDRAQDQSNCYWVGLKSILGAYCDDPRDVYGDVTLIAMRIKATEGLSSNAHNRVSVLCTRKLDGVATRHPVDAFGDILLNDRYGGRRPSDELDSEALEGVRAEVPDCTFDGIFDQRSTIWEALSLSVQMIRGIPVTDGAVVSLVRDKPQNTPVAAFSQDNMTDLTISYLFVEQDDFDGYEGEYVDPLDGSKQYTTWPLTAANPESVTLWGCTSLARAQCYLEQFWRQKTLRRRLATFGTELDAHTLNLGDPINLTHPLLGDDPVLHVVSSVRAKDEYHCTVEAYRYEPGVFSA